MSTPKFWLQGACAHASLARISAMMLDAIFARPCVIGGQGEGVVAPDGFQGGGMVGAVKARTADRSGTTASFTHPLLISKVERACVADVMESSISNRLVPTDISATSISASLSSTRRSNLASFAVKRCNRFVVWADNFWRRVGRRRRSFG